MGRPRGNRIVRLKVGNKVGEFLTVAGLCNELGISVSYLKKLVDAGTVPQANYRLSKPNWKREGDKVYSVNLARELKPIFATFRQGVKIDDESKRLIAQAFLNEKIYFNNNE